MSLQVFLQAQLLGSEDFLAAQSPEGQNDTAHFTGRCAWLNLIGEVLPRALLAELKLSKMLLGSSSAEQFFLVLAEEEIPHANAFLGAAAKAISTLSRDKVRLVWVSTENLGAWPVARKRLDDALSAKISAPLSTDAGADGFFAPFVPDAVEDEQDYFTQFAAKLPSATRVGWSSEHPAYVLWDEGQYSWPLRDQSEPDDDGILFPRRFGSNEDGTSPAALAELAKRAEGTAHWGVLRGDVDQFGLRLQHASSIEEHLHLSILFKEFFAGELAILCTLPEFWRSVRILYRGGDDFAVAGSWDALILLGRELHRLFEKFAEQNLQSFAGVEGKTLSTALAIAPDLDTPLAAVFEEAGADLRSAKANEAGTFHLFGRTLEWKRLSDAEELKTSLVHLVRGYGFSPGYINDLASVYRESFSARAVRRSKAVRVDKPWRTYMRVSRVLPQTRSKEVINLRNTIVTHLLGKKISGLKLRPSARVGLEWARLAAGS
jgi:CRISPR-associated protein Csm1